MERDSVPEPRRATERICHNSYQVAPCCRNFTAQTPSKHPHFPPRSASGDARGYANEDSECHVRGCDAGGLMVRGQRSIRRGRRVLSSAEVLKWMNSYRSKPDPMRAALAIHQLSGFGELRNQESAGVMPASPPAYSPPIRQSAQALVTRCCQCRPRINGSWCVRLPIPASRPGGCRHRHSRHAGAGARTDAAEIRRRHCRRCDNSRLTAHHRTGPIVSLNTCRSMRSRRLCRQCLRPSPELLDTFWGFTTTGDTAALQNIISLLPWSTDRDNVQRLTLGGMAKYTLAENASRIGPARDDQNGSRPEPKDVQPVLDQVIEAADNVDVSSPAERNALPRSTN